MFLEHTESYNTGRASAKSNMRSYPLLWPVVNEVTDESRFYSNIIQKSNNQLLNKKLTPSLTWASKLTRPSVSHTGVPPCFFSPYLATFSVPTLSISTESLCISCAMYWEDREIDYWARGYSQDVSFWRCEGGAKTLRTKCVKCALTDFCFLSAFLWTSRSLTCTIFCIILVVIQFRFKR